MLISIHYKLKLKCNNNSKYVNNVNLEIDYPIYYVP